MRRLHELKLQGVVEDLSDPKVFTGLLDNLMEKEWCVYSKKPFNGAKGAVDYLAKYQMVRKKNIVSE